MRLALIGYGNVGRAFANLLRRTRDSHNFRITAITTARHGSVFDQRGIEGEPKFGPAVTPVGEFLDRARADAVVEITTLNPASGEPAISHIRAAFERNKHVVTANKGPIAHAYRALRDEARRAEVEFRCEASVMDGAPVFNLVRHTLPGVRILGFRGVLNSTSKVIIDCMRQGLSMEDGVEQARRLGITEADASYDIEGWDAAAKTAALANVLLDAGVTPLDIDRKGIGRLTTDKVLELKANRKTVALVSRAHRGPGGWKLRVRAEVLDEGDPFAALPGASNLLLLDTDLMGTVGVMEVAGGVEQTAYGLYSDLIEIARLTGL